MSAAGTSNIRTPYGEKRTFENSDINRTDYNVGFDRILGNDRLRLEFSATRRTTATAFF